MEDPNSRPPAAKLINEEILRYQLDVSKGEFRAGLSLAMRIYYALKQADYLKEG